MRARQQIQVVCVLQRVSLSGHGGGPSSRARASWARQSRAYGWVTLSRAHSAGMSHSGASFCKIGALGQRLFDLQTHRQIPLQRQQPLTAYGLPCSLSHSSECCARPLPTEGSVMSYQNLANDRQFAKSKMPQNTREVASDGCTGFKYDITCELGKKYQLFAYFNGSRYRVLVVTPQVEGKAHVQLTKVFPDSSLCLEPTMTGCRTLEEAFAKSVLWANGYSVYELAGRFPFGAIL